jgi:anti-anti-sigma regulatory factor
MDKSRTVKIPQVLDREWVTKCGLIGGGHGGRLVLDMSGTERIDSAGICFIGLLKKLRGRGGGELVLEGARESVARQLSSAEALPVPET